MRDAGFTKEYLLRNNYLKYCIIVVATIVVLGGCFNSKSHLRNVAEFEYVEFYDDRNDIREGHLEVGEHCNWIAPANVNKAIENNAPGDIYYFNLQRKRLLIGILPLPPVFPPVWLDCYVVYGELEDRRRSQ